jgi:hypothetical protein
MRARLLLGLAAGLSALQIATGVVATRWSSYSENGLDPDFPASLILPAAIAAVVLAVAALLSGKARRTLALAALLPALARAGCGLPGAFVVLDGGRPLTGWAAAAEVVADTAVLPLIITAIVMTRRYPTSIV